MQATDRQEKEFKMGIHLFYVKESGEKLNHIFRALKVVISTFSIRKTLHELFHKFNYQIVTEIKPTLFMKLIVAAVKLQNTVGKKIKTLTGIKRKLLI